MSSERNCIPLEKALPLLCDTKARLREFMRDWAVGLANNPNDKGLADAILGANDVLANIDVLEDTIRTDIKDRELEEAILDVSGEV